MTATIVITKKLYFKLEPTIHLIISEFLLAKRKLLQNSDCVIFCRNRKTTFKKIAIIVE
jgi:hypothetical protein